jgi:hypothetical protein
MKTDLIKIKRLENKQELEELTEGEVVIISVGSEKIFDNKEYYGLAMFIGKRFKKGTKDYGFDFCRPHANCGDCLIGYHINENEILIIENGIISALNFATYGYKTELIKNSGLI